MYAAHEMRSAYELDINMIFYTASLMFVDS